MSEILAPAGSQEVLSAALAAGADAIYFGLKKLNARRGAENFSPETLGKTVEQIHASGAKAYLTLNIQLCQRELGLAFRTLQCAQDAGVDAVLVTDPALLLVMPHFPKLDFHFSTQAAVSSSAGVRAARELGLKRIVLARELSRDEIAACASCGIEIETFIQGAHCFSCSGRCLLSSWGGGRSGNRGACTSPCRVRWTNRDGLSCNPLSMHDMSLLPDLPELEKLHVASYKIEGRLKTAQWVGAAVKLARAALSPDTDRNELQAQTQALGDYTGRKLSDDFFHGRRDGLTGDSARPSATGLDCGTGRVEDDAPPCLVINISQDERGGLVAQLTHGETTDSLRIPPQRIANPRRAVTLSDILADVPAAMPKNEPAPIVNVPQELAERLLPKSIRNNFLDAITAFFRRKAKEGDGVVRNIGLPQAVRQLLEAKPAPCPNNSRKLGDKPTHTRIDFTQLENAVKAIVEPLVVNVCPMAENEAADIVEAVKRHIRRIHAVALPDVIYEHQVPVIRELLKRLSSCRVAIEVNSWDTWWLAKEASVTMEAGPGLAVLNATAAEMLHRLGCRSVSVSPEIDKGQLEDLCSAVSVPLSITVFSRPKLMQTRAILPDGFRPEDNAKFEDARHIALKPEKCGEITVLRPTVPLDWRSLRNPSVHAAMLVADLSACRNLEMPRTDKPFLFNYDRRLR